MALPVLISAILFYLSFPNFIFLQGFSSLAWFFCVPFFIFLEGKSLLNRLAAGFFFGLLSYLATLNWMIPYSFPGYGLLSIILTCQTVIFAALYQPSKDQKFWPLLYVPAAWVVSEYIRKFVMMGQSWDLGHSQGFDTDLLRTARLFGSPGISFILIFVNYLFYWLLLRAKETSQRKVGASILALLILTIYVYRFFVPLPPGSNSSTALQICLLQPNIDYHGELTDERIMQITDEHIALTREAVKHSHPDLIVWPETAVPTDFLADPRLKKKIVSLVKDIGTPFLIGGDIDDKTGTHNSAVLFDKNGEVENIYFKRHLVPLTEYIPPSFFWKMFAKIFHVESPGLVPGTAEGMMEITARTSNVKIRFGVAICSEDNVAQVFRQYAEDGAGFVIVLLNNGWFSQKEGLVMHAEHSMMHAAENDMPVIRVSNTGLSGLIDRYGRLPQESLDSLEQRKFFLYEVVPRPPKKSSHNLSDTFCVLCLCFVIMKHIYSSFQRKKGNKE